MELNVMTKVGDGVTPTMLDVPGDESKIGYWWPFTEPLPEMYDKAAVEAYLAEEGDGLA